MLSFFRKSSSAPSASKLFNEKTFYQAFKKDLAQCKYEVIIESPFITGRRVESLLPMLRRAIERDVKVIVNTRDPLLHEPPYDGFAIDAIAELERVGGEVIYTGNHHRKLAIFDRRVLWKGSLNILSQYDSCEIMRRIESSELSKEMIGFIKIGRYLD